jgi:hypothetical protein
MTVWGGNGGKFTVVDTFGRTDASFRGFREVHPRLRIGLCTGVPLC